VAIGGLTPPLLDSELIGASEEAILEASGNSISGVELGTENVELLNYRGFEKLNCIYQMIQKILENLRFHRDKLGS